MRKPRVVIGVDCGESATKTRISNLDQLNLAESASESLWNGNFYIQEKLAADKINRLILSICKENGIGFDQITGIVFAFPGNLHKNKQVAIVNSLRDHWKRRKYIPKILKAISTPFLVLDTLYSEKPAIFMSCDTNVYVFARDSKGEFISAGGWGGAVPDPGSTPAITNSVLQYITQVYDKRSMNSPFFKEITKEFFIETPEEFHKILFGDIDIMRIAEFTFRAADNRNIVAMSMIDSAAHQLVDLIRHIATRLPVSKRIPLVFSGRLIEDEKMYRSIVQRKINATLPHIAISPQKLNVAEFSVQYAVDMVREGKSLKKKL